VTAITPEALIAFIRSIYSDCVSDIPLHAPIFQGKEREYVADCLDSTFVSSVGPYVTRLEEMICAVTGAAHAVATNSGTAALHAALLTVGVGRDDEVLTQSISFVATANAISYCNAKPLFIDIEPSTMGLCPATLKDFFVRRTGMRDGACYNLHSGRRIAACVPMHTFGHPAQVQAIVDICTMYGVPVIEDAAEALGSFLNNRHCGTFGLAGVISFNGNKIVTSGGGGMIVTDNKEFAARARHLTTTAKKPHPYAYEHTEVGYNYRMPNINAALCCGQMEQLDGFLEKKRSVAHAYQSFFQGSNLTFMVEPPGARSNYWLNTVLVENRETRDALLVATNGARVMTRPVWTPLNRLPMFEASETHGGDVAASLADRIINLPSSVPA